MNTSDGIEFGENGLLPAIVQDAESGEVLMLAYMNPRALAMTLERADLVLSRSRCELGTREKHQKRPAREGTETRCDGDAWSCVSQVGSGACHTDGALLHRVLTRTPPEVSVWSSTKHLRIR